MIVGLRGMTITIRLVVGLLGLAVGPWIKILFDTMRYLPICIGFLVERNDNLEKIIVQAYSFKKMIYQ